MGADGVKHRIIIKKIDVRKRQYKKYNVAYCPNDNTKTILIKNWKSIPVFLDGLNPTSYIYVLAATLLDTSRLLIGHFFRHFKTAL